MRFEQFMINQKEMDDEEEVLLSSENDCRRPFMDKSIYEDKENVDIEIDSSYKKRQFNNTTERSSNFTKEYFKQNGPLFDTICLKEHEFNSLRENENIKIIDCRSFDEYTTKNFEGSLHLTFADKIVDSIKKLDCDVIVFYGSSHTKALEFAKECRNSFSHVDLEIYVFTGC